MTFSIERKPELIEVWESRMLAWLARHKQARNIQGKKDSKDGKSWNTDDLLVVVTKKSHPLYLKPGQYVANAVRGEGVITMQDPDRWQYIFLSRCRTDCYVTARDWEPVVKWLISERDWELLEEGSPGIREFSSRRSSVRGSTGRK